MKIEDTQRAHINFPLDLLAKLRESAKVNRRSFNQEVMYRLEQSYTQDNESKVKVNK